MTASPISKDGEFDLAGYEEPRITKLMKDAFAEPWQKAARISLVVGGGKQVRQKYHADLMRNMGMALLSLGYSEDRGAGLGSSKVFKTQHDTNRNLKLVHVFPGVQGVAEKEVDWVLCKMTEFKVRAGVFHFFIISSNSAR